MGRHFNLLLIWISLLTSTKGQVLFDDVDDRQQNSLDSAMYLIKHELQQMMKNFEKMLLQKLEETQNNLVENFKETLEDKLTCHSHLTRVSGTDCADILKRCPNTRWKDGVYKILDVSYKPKAVYCDMTTDNGGWTVIHRRVNGSVDFYRNWTEYKNGFGLADHEYWIGNEMLHTLTSLKPQELRVDMGRFNGEKAYALYSNFSVGDEASKYKLEVNGYSGNAGDSLNASNNMMFTTMDQDNDIYSGSNCAIVLQSAGWFFYCSYANPNGQYIDYEISGLHSEYITWFSWKNTWVSLKTMQMMIRPRD